MTLEEAQVYVGSERYIAGAVFSVVRCFQVVLMVNRSAPQVLGNAVGGPYRPVEQEPDYEVYMMWSGVTRGGLCGRTPVRRWVALPHSFDEYRASRGVVRRPQGTVVRDLRGQCSRHTPPPPVTSRAP